MLRHAPHVLPQLFDFEQRERDIEDSVYGQVRLSARPPRRGIVEAEDGRQDTHRAVRGRFQRFMVSRLEEYHRDVPIVAAGLHLRPTARPSWLA